jgi:hypothetical protein
LRPIAQEEEKMPPTFLEFMTHSRAESVRDALQHWQARALPALNAEDRRYVTRVCLDLAKDLRDIVQRQTRAVCRQPAQAVQALQEQRQALEELCEQVHKTLAAVQTALGPQGRLAETAEEGPGLDGAMEEVRAARERLLQHWPVRSPAEVAAARQRMEHGEGADAEAAFARIAGVDVETWRQRVEEHRRRKA